MIKYDVRDKVDDLMPVGKQRPSLRRILLRSGVIGIVVIIIFWIIIPDFGSHRQAYRAQCASNLRAIVIACMCYASADGVGPPTLDILLEGGERAYLLPKQLICPVSKKRYIYISNQSIKPDYRTVVVYEPLSNHANEGANMAFVDSHVCWHTPQQYWTVLNETKSRLQEDNSLINSNNYP
ncbi:MAG: hypothetical protein ACYTF1_09160 [Planctomycetota bacterium]|jgi:prepilin-type processing-associated H-X9-DG protein